MIKQTNRKSFDRAEFGGREDRTRSEPDAAPPRRHGRQGQPCELQIARCSGRDGHQFVAEFLGLALQLLELAFLDLGFQMIRARIFVRMQDAPSKPTSGASFSSKL